jgi:hypothetical protein
MQAVSPLRSRLRKPVMHHVEEASREAPLSRAKRNKIITGIKSISIARE